MISTKLDEHKRRCYGLVSTCLIHEADRAALADTTWQTNKVFRRSHMLIASVDSPVRRTSRYRCNRRSRQRLPSSGGRRFLVAATDPTISSGAIGVAEACDLRRLVQRARDEALALVLIIDSAGARVSEGVAIQGALRRLFAALLAARAAGLRTIAMLGRNVFGGASMLAMCCESRLYFPRTRLAMTGPAVVQEGEPVFQPRSVAETFAAAGRLEHDRGGTLIDAADDSGVSAALTHALAQSAMDFTAWLRAQGVDLRARLGTVIRPTADAHGSDRRSRPRCSSAERARPGRVRSWHWSLCWLPMPETQRHLVLDCEWSGHSMRLTDEKRLLSQYLAYLAGVIYALEARGTRICLRILGELSGGLYIALAGACSQVQLGAGAKVAHPAAVRARCLRQPARSA